MKRITITLLFMTIWFVSKGQSFDTFLLNIEHNNPRLTALKKWLEAEETKAKTSLYPDNPEVSYNYLWGNSESLGNQQELEISQAFKLPGYYTSKAAVQKLNFQQKKAFAEKEKREILHVARTSWFKLVWLHKKEALLKTRNDDAVKLAALMKKGFENGEISKPAFDKVRIYAVHIQTAWQKNQSEIEVQYQFIQQLNGDKPIEVKVFEYPCNWDLPELDSLLENISVNNPHLQMAQLSIFQYENELKQQRMNSLPSFKAGYKSEKILNQKLQGFHAGMSIPLWQNNYSVKHAKLQTEWSKANFTQQKSEVKSQLSGLFLELTALKKNHEQMKLIMEEETISESSLNLLQSGQISFTEYLVDIELIWDAQIQFLNNENAYFDMLSKLKTFE